MESFSSHRAVAATASPVRAVSAETPTHVAAHTAIMINLTSGGILMGTFAQYMPPRPKAKGSMESPRVPIAGHPLRPFGDTEIVAFRGEDAKVAHSPRLALDAIGNLPAWMFLRGRESLVQIVHHQTDL